MVIRDIYGFDFDPNDPGEAPYLSPEPDIDLSRYLENPRIFNNVSLPSVRPDGTNWNTEDIVVRQTPEQIPDYEPSLYTPEGAVNRAKYLTSQGINPTFTNTPIDFAGKSYADSGQVAVDMRPPSRREPTEADISLVQKLTRFEKNLDDEMYNSGNYGSRSFQTPEQQAEMLERKKLYMTQFASRLMEKEFRRPEKLNLVGFDPVTKEEVYDTGRGTAYRDGTPYTRREPFLPKTSQEKDVNVSNEIETILAGMFPGFYTDKKVREKAYSYYGTEKGSKEVQDKAVEYSKSKIPSQYTPITTSEGIGAFQTKGEGAGSIKQTGQPYSKPLPESATKEFGSLSALKKFTEDAAKLYKENNGADWVGPVSGRYYSGAENLYDLPEQQVKFNAYINDIKDYLLRARSGAQINEQEYKRLVKFLPTVELPSGNFESRMNRFYEELNTMISEKGNIYETQGYDVSGFVNKKKQDSQNAPPMEKLKEGVIVTFANGQVWTLKNGKPVRTK